VPSSSSSSSSAARYVATLVLQPLLIPLCCVKPSTHP
jgi:hypothetical protein